ncbi:MAG TPA: hypothetical protein DCM05_00140 [Elusimicrobia bacterium]|nr:hypothetical protein [Elusimicrobiota bacterium]
MADTEKKQGKAKFPKYFTIIYAFFLMVLAIAGAFRGLDNSWSDSLFRLRGMRMADNRITLVAIDDKSIEKIGQYPWPRRVYSELLEKLFKLGVKVVAFDIHFPDKSGSPKDDAALVAVTKKYSDKVIHGVFRNDQPGVKVPWVYPFEELRKVTKHLGLVVPPGLERDGSVRRTTLFMGTDPADIYNWVDDPDKFAVYGLALTALYEGKKPEDYLDELGNYITLNVPGQKEVEREVTEVEGSKMVRKTRLEWEYGVRRIGAWRILEDSLKDDEKAALKDGIVMLGSISVGAFDHFPNPFFEMAPGAEVHLSLVDNLLNRNYLRDFHPLWHLPMIAAMAVAGYAITLLAPLPATALFFALLASWLGLGYLLFLKLVLIDYAGPTLAFAGVFVALMLHRALMEEKQKREVRQMFGQYVSPEVVDILVKDPSKIRLGGDKRDMTIFFLDIAHFTTISEKMTPENLIKFLNTYLTELTGVIMTNKGVVDKYIGDCVMAFWNAPLDTPNHRTCACTAAVECIDAIRKLNESYVDPTIPEKPAVRIGLNSGEVVVGNTGSAQKLAYTVLGDDVNLASRLEGANKYFGSTVMASESTYNEAKDAVEARFLGSVRVVGKAIPIKVFELFSKKGQLPEVWKKALPAYEEGVALYLKKDFAAAKGRFEEVLQHVPGDKCSKLYLKNIAELLATPPAADWDGVFNLTSK